MQRDRYTLLEKLSGFQEIVDKSAAIIKRSKAATKKRTKAVTAKHRTPSKFERQTGRESKEKMEIDKDKTIKQILPGQNSGISHDLPKHD